MQLLEKKQTWNVDSLREAVDMKLEADARGAGEYWNKVRMLAEQSFERLAIVIREVVAERFDTLPQAEAASRTPTSTQGPRELRSTSAFSELAYSPTAATSQEIRSAASRASSSIRTPIRLRSSETGSHSQEQNSSATSKTTS